MFRNLYCLRMRTSLVVRRKKNAPARIRQPNSANTRRAKPRSCATGPSVAAMLAPGDRGAGTVS